MSWNTRNDGHGPLSWQFETGATPDTEGSDPPPAVTREQAAGIVKWADGEKVRVESVTLDNGRTFTIEQLRVIAEFGR